MKKLSRFETKESEKEKADKDIRLCLQCDDKIEYRLMPLHMQKKHNADPNNQLTFVDKEWLRTKNVPFTSRKRKKTQQKDDNDGDDDGLPEMQIEVTTQEENKEKDKRIACPHCKKKVHSIPRHIDKKHPEVADAPNAIIIRRRMHSIWKRSQRKKKYVAVVTNPISVIRYFLIYLYMSGYTYGFINEFSWNKKIPMWILIAWMMLILMLRKAWRMLIFLLMLRNVRMSGSPHHC